MSEFWYGYDMEMLTFEGMPGLVVFPKKGTANGRLGIKTEYWNAFPEAVELEMLAQGFHLCYIKNVNRWGLEEDVERKARFIRHVAQTYGLNEKTVPVGMSCGGMFAIKLAVSHPEVVSCLYLDAPLIQHMSINNCKASDEALLQDEIMQEIMGALDLKTVDALRSYDKMPIHMMDKLLALRIPAVLVVGAADTVLPVEENGLLLKKYYDESGIPIRVHVKPNCDHHPHGWDDPKEAMQDILDLMM